MNKLTFVSGLLLAAILGLTSCGNSPKIKYYAFKSSEKGDWGLISTDGEVVFEDEFDKKPSTPFNDRFIVENKDGEKNIYTVDSKPEQVGDDYLQIADFIQKVTPAVKKGEQIKLIDRDGNEVKTLDKIGGKTVKAVGRFTASGLALVGVEKDNEHFLGCIDTDGEAVIDPKYDNLFIMDYGTDLVMALTNKGDNPKLEFLNTKGEKVFSLSSSKYNLEETSKLILKNFGQEKIVLGLAQKIKYIPVVKEGDERKLGLIDLNGEEVMKPSGKYKNFDLYDDFMIVERDNDQYGTMSYDGEWIIRAKFDSMRYNGENIFVAKQNDKLRLLDANGERIGQSYKTGTDIGPFIGGKALVELDDHEYGFIDTEGNEIDSKDSPEIYKVDFKFADEAVQSDYMDVDAIVSAINLTDKGMGGWSFDLTPGQVASVYNQQSGNSGDAKPEDFGNYSSLRYTKYIEKTEMQFNISYGNKSMTNSSYNYDYYSYYSSTTYSWSSAKPEGIEVAITGERAASNHKAIYDAIVAKLKKIGKLKNSNDTAAVFSLGSDRCAVVIHGNAGVQVAYALLDASQVDLSSLSLSIDGDYAEEAAAPAAEWEEYAPAAEVDSLAYGGVAVDSAYVEY